MAFARRTLRTGTIVLAIVLAWTFLVPPSARAQDTTTARTMTLDQAIDVALDRNASLRRARNDRQLQDAMVAREYASFLPSLSFSTSGNQRYGLAFDQTAGELVTQSSDALNAGLSARVTLFDGFANFASLDQARYQREQSEETLQRSRQQVVFQVLSRYLQVVLDQETVRIQEEALEAQREQLRRIEQLTEAGVRPQSDLYQQRSNVASRELQLLDARQTLSSSRTGLVEVLQLDPYRTYRFEAPAMQEVDSTDTSYELDRLLRTAVERRSDLEAAETGVSIAREGVRIARAGRWPSVSLSGSMGTSFTSNRPTDFTSQLEDNRSGSIGLSLSIPLFDQLQTRSQVQQARVQFENAQLDRETLEQQIVTEVRQSYRDFQHARQRLAATAAQLDAAEQALEATQNRYELGSAPFSDLASARADLVSAESDRSQAVFQYHFQQKLIDYYIGVLNPDSRLFE